MEEGWFLVGSSSISSEWSPKRRVNRCQKKVRWSWSKTDPSIKMVKLAKLIDIGFGTNHATFLDNRLGLTIFNHSKTGLGRRKKQRRRERRKGTNTEITLAALETQDLDITFIRSWDYRPYFTAYHFTGFFFEPLSSHVFSCPVFPRILGMSSAMNSSLSVQHPQ